MSNTQLHAAIKRRLGKHKLQRSQQLLDMEAVLISFLIDKLGGIAVDQAKGVCSQVLLQRRTPPLDQIQTCIDRITAQLKMMKAFLEGSNWSTTAAAADKPLEAWIEQVRTVAFKVEDIIDEYLYLVGEQRERTWKDYLSRPKYLCCNLAKVWHAIDSRLKETENEISNLLAMRVGFGLTISGNEDRVKNSERDTHHYRAYSPMLIDEDDLVGIEDNKSKLVSWLTNADTCRKMTAIAVWGMGGQGKTTLVSNVYRHNNTVKRHFDCQVWLTVSQNFSVEELLRTMIQEIKGKMESITTMPRSQLLEIIKESLEQKRYIVVLDDVWRVGVWNDLSHAFIDSNNGSRLVVTTRNREVARIANEEHIIELKQLNEKDAWILFCKKAFRRENNNVCPLELEDYAGKILKKCQGSPLAIVSIGSLLSFKEKSEPEWKKVHDRLHWEFQNDPELDKVQNILNLSFNDLPCYLKNCFVYCSIFPEDYLIKRKKLIRLWIAEGFVEARSTKRSMEEEAEDYLAELVDRSMLQVVEREIVGRFKAFRMHDVVREVTLAISRKTKFCMILDGSESVLDNQTRRLSILTNDKSLDLITSLSRLRSLVVFSTSYLSLGSLRTVLMSFKMLRVLELEGTGISKLPNEVSDLFNLHYLGLRDSNVEQLPNNIQKLQSLQTLDLRYSSIRKLPRGVTQLKQLRHLFMSVRVFGGSTIVGCVPTLEGAWQWKNLQTLIWVRANKILVQRLGDMKELRTLGVMKVQQAHCPQLCTSLTKMSNLRSLWISSEGGQLDFEMLNSPPPPLQKLTLQGTLFEGKVPRFICSCSELILVRLSRSRLFEDPLPSFGELPKLAELILENGVFEGQKLHFRTGWFPNLKSLILRDMQNLNDIVIEEGAMTNLHELSMNWLSGLRLIPLGIEFLTNLQTLNLLSMPEELVRKCKKEDDNEDRQRIRHISKMESITTMPRSQLLEIIKENLEQKRYIVVLDDVWRVGLLNDLSHAFIDSNNGSRLVVTTRNLEVARIANEEHIIELKQLNEKDAWILFCKKAFRRENNNVCPLELEDYAGKILKKCQGSPLAIVSIGSLLSFKEKSEPEWKKVHDRLHWEFQNDPELDKVQNILNLSFNDLPCYLKNCFVYCSIFPEDYLIKRKKLIRLWIAEGFVEARSTKRSMEEEAEDYLAELVDRSMLQVVEREIVGRFKAFRMHDVVREVTLAISRKTKFCMILDGSESVLDNQTRRLSILTNDKSLDLITSLSRLRSLVVFSTSYLSLGSLRTVLMSFKMLRVLELEGTGISKLPNEVSDLFNLHYLGLRDSNVEQLPNNIQKLQSLQTLDLRYSSIRKLPRGVTQLKQLRHLFISGCEFGGSTIVGCVSTLEGAWQWKNLQTLMWVPANKILVQRLGDMKELRTLGVTQVQQAHCPQLCTSLTKMSNLRSLWISSEEGGQLDFEMLNSPPPPLQKLSLEGTLFEGKVPRFICSCSELRLVELYGSCLFEDPLPSFGELPKLAKLILEDCVFEGQKLHFRTGWFPNLKRLFLKDMQNLNDIVIEEGAMTNLHELSMYWLRELRMIPLGIEFLTNLQTLNLRSMPEELVRKCKKEDDNEDRRRIRHISNVFIDRKRI